MSSKACFVLNKAVQAEYWKQHLLLYELLLLEMFGSIKDLWIVFFQSLPMISFTYYLGIDISVWKLFDCLASILGENRNVSENKNEERNTGQDNGGNKRVVRYDK